MKNSTIKKENNGGYAILFTVIIVSAISVITAGISNAVYKQIVLSSLAKDSQTAFYQADTASDCALLAEMDETFVKDSNHDWNCGGVTMDVITRGADGYDILPKSALASSMSPCYRITIDKDSSTPPTIKTTIKANGYNICKKDNIRTVERQIKIEYSE